MSVLETKDELLARLNTALEEVTTAEGVLETVLKALGNEGPRAQKVAVSADVSDAFTRLRKAREELKTLRDLIAAA